MKDGSGKDRWSVIESNREIAVATPEQNGDGTWVVHDVQACGAPKASPAVVDGVLDCVSDRIWSEQATFALGAKGELDAQVAIAAALKPFNDRYGGEVVFHDTGTGSLVVGGREQVQARASAVPAGGFLIDVVQHCDGFGR